MATKAVDDKVNEGERKLRELQEERNALAAKIRELGEKRTEWAADDETAWQKLNADYDACKQRQDDEIAAQQRDREVSARLAAIEHDDKQERGGRRVGLDHRERREADPVVRRRQIEARKELWLQGTMLRSAGLTHKLRKRHHDAARILRRPLSRGFAFNMPTLTYAPIWMGQEIKRANGVEYRDLAVSSEPEVIPEGFMAEFEISLKAFGGACCS